MIINYYTLVFFSKHHLCIFTIFFLVIFIFVAFISCFRVTSYCVVPMAITTQSPCLIYHGFDYEPLDHNLISLSM